MNSFPGHAIHPRSLQPVDLIHKSNSIIAVIISEDENNVHRFAIGCLRKRNSYMQYREINNQVFFHCYAICLYSWFESQGTVMMEAGRMAYPGKNN